MADITYHIVRHDGGWAYKVNDTYSERFPSHDAALRAAQEAAARQEQAGETTGIVYEDPAGKWHEEVADGGDRPNTRVED